ncbi:peptidase S10 [Microlunatus endophyticus]|uniref:Peptidase S10 n=1 Tax=Microlunatus endophyticus TaxID=1716077 RepID=A0A917SGY4_9ACTN|nr:peptidase S10 [Microlunatus endophyticus]GGL78116.1 peptidase S10 [Microlunatus endophyticus]
MTDDAKATEQPAPADYLVTSTGSIGSGEQRLEYHVSCGRMVLREEIIEDQKFGGHQARAEIFHIAYTLDGAEPGSRPVTFAFNGGPGSSSVWLHLGLLGPRRVIMGDAGDLKPPPYAIEDNLQTLLTETDLVFIDPVTTGFSRTVEGHRADDFHGFGRDLESVGEFIRLWATRNGRWSSPKFLAGESYGTTRAAGLANRLQSEYGMYVNGVILISSILDFASADFTEGNDQAFALYLPTYAATAHYHGKLADDLGDLADVVAQAEDFAARDLPYALARGSRLPTDERRAVIERYARLTGLDPAYVDRADLRITLFDFVAELMRDRQQLVGRLDMRFVGWLDHGNDSHMDYDPSYSAILGPYATAFNSYIRDECGFKIDIPYNILTPKVYPWSYKEFENASVETATALAKALRDNPALRVHISCGYYDGATPHFAAEHVIAHLRIPAAARERIEWAYYEAGHMTYVHEPSRQQQSEDLRAFIRSAT